MLKILCIVALLPIIQQAHSSTPIDCYKCETACEIEQSTEIVSCGETIGETQEPVCTTQSQLNNKERPETKLIRKCQIRTKGQGNPFCPEGDVCTVCTTNKCNGGSRLYVDFAAVALTALILVPRYF